MSKQTVQVIIEREVQLNAPGMLGRKFNFKAGHSFLTQEWFFPGELLEKDALAGRPSHQWSFGTNSRTDLPLIFAAEDVLEVVNPSDAETIEIFKGAPFKVIIQDRQS